MHTKRKSLKFSPPFFLMVYPNLDSYMWYLYMYNVNSCIIVKEDDIIGKLNFAFATSLSLLLTISRNFKER